jgi:putative ABC transport system permease protein
VFEFVIAWQAIAVSVIAAFFTVLLSAWLPARKAAEIPAIDAIRGTGEVKFKAKQIRPNRLVVKLFGFEGLLASKSLRRSKRSFRAAVVSLSASITLFIAAGGIGAQVDNMTNLLFPNIDVSVAAQAMSAFQISFGDESEAPNFLYTPIKSNIADEIAAKLREFPGTSLIGVGGFYHASSATLPENMITPEMLEIIGNRRFDGNYDVSVWLLTVDSENYAKLCEQAGVPLGSNILVNYYRHTANDGRKSAFAPYLFSNQTIQIESISLDAWPSSAIARPGVPAMDVTLHGELGEVPEELLYGFNAVRSELTVIVPRLDAIYYNWFANSADIDGFLEYADAIVNELIPKDGDVEMFISVTDVSVATEAIRNIINLIKAFIYGFVGMLTLIGLTNVISTISTNVRSRSREFAVLRSVGMTHSGFNRMLNLESILCSVKSLIIGLPLGGGASFLIHRFMMLSMGFDYRFPWLVIVHCILGVFVITWVTMRYSAIQIRGGSIVEQIRKEVA